MAPRRVLVIASLILTFGAGWVAALVVPEMLSPRIKTEWFEVVPPPGAKGISYSIEAFAKSDIPLPEIKGMTGTAKFVNDGSGQPSYVRFGYKLSVEIAPLDLSKVPAKYRKQKPVDIGGGKKITQLPIDQVTYDTTFDFTLKDKDGFTLIELPSAAHTIESGKTNTFQAFAPDAVPVGIASRTTQVVLGMNVKKCVTCEDE